MIQFKLYSLKAIFLNRGALLSLLAVSLFLILRYEGVDPSLAQLLSFPLIVLLLYNVRFESWKIPLPVLGMGVLLTAICAIFSYNFSASQSEVILMARLSDDEFESRTRVFREWLNSSLPANSPLYAKRFYRPVNSDEDVQKILSSGNKIKGIVWGDSTWLRYSELGFKLEPIPAKWPERMRLQLISDIEDIIVSFDPQGETARYIANLVTGRHAAGASQEPLLKYAATIEGAWRSSQHRGYAMWQLGNSQLQNGILGDYQAAEVRCAIDSYSRAFKYLKFEDNPELYLSICNNRAIAIYIQSVYEAGQKHKPALKKRAVRSFKKGLKALEIARKRSYREKPKSILVLKRNFKTLKPRKVEKKRKGTSRSQRAGGGF